MSILRHQINTERKTIFQKIDSGPELAYKPDCRPKRQSIFVDTFIRFGILGTRYIRTYVLHILYTLCILYVRTYCAYCTYYTLHNIVVIVIIMITISLHPIRIPTPTCSPPKPSPGQQKEFHRQTQHITKTTYTYTEHRQTADPLP